MDNDEIYMKRALELARECAACDEVPVGAVVVKDGRIIAEGCNFKERELNAVRHAEIVALERAAEAVGNWWLEDCDLYVTLEPCPMCAGAVVQARIPRVVMACMNPKAGCAGSVLDLFHQDGFNHQVETEVGLMGEECSQMLKDFFRELRKKTKERHAKEKEAGALTK